MRSFRHFFPSWIRVFLKTRVTGDTGYHPELRASPSWRALYVAALFEPDEGRKVQRIDEAKKALVMRARELFQTAGDHLEEQSAIEETLQSLRVLEQCVVHLYPEALSGETDGRGFDYTAGLVNLASHVSR
jgi:hypothetical protein